MLTELKQGNKVVGLKQSQRAVSAGQALKAFIARDAAQQLQTEFAALCAEHAVETITVDTMLNWVMPAASRSALRLPSCCSKPSYCGRRRNPPPPV